MPTNNLVISYVSFRKSSPLLREDGKNHVQPLGAFSKNIMLVHVRGGGFFKWRVIRKFTSKREPYEKGACVIGRGWFDYQRITEI